MSPINDLYFEGFYMQIAKSKTLIAKIVELNSARGCQQIKVAKPKANNQETGWSQRASNCDREIKHAIRHKYFAPPPWNFDKSTF